MKKFFKIFLFTSVIVVAGIFLSGCTPTSNTSTDTNDSDPEVTENTITIKNMSFSPSTLNVKVGDTVTWVNSDGFSHTITSDDGKFDGGTISNGKTLEVTFSEEGTYEYHCEIHPTMKAKIVVSAE